MIGSVDGYTVGEVARSSGVSVRTLHHYDAIGLLTPDKRSTAGYRLYSEADLRRLRHVLFYRELGFGLHQIAEILADPDARTDDHLRRQHRLLRERQARTGALLGAIEHEMEARQMGIALTPTEQLEIFGTARFAQHADEAHERLGDTGASRESRRRTATYGKEDWVAIKAEAEENIRRFADAMRAGEPATGPAAMELAEEHRAHISRWFYACDHVQHRQLAASYVADPATTASWDDVAPGFSRYVHDAIIANADRATA
jgi:MerR family transcriptional regulator, thiopeptide resistance regulator